MHLKKTLQGIVNRFGYKITAVSSSGLPEVDGVDPEFIRIFKAYKPYTMTSPERMYALYRSVRYVLDAHIPGDFVECGVWRGGSSMIIADMLHKANSDKKIFLYDTFEGMSEPTTKDVSALGGHAAISKWKTTTQEHHSEWCYASLQEVKKNMQKIGYADEKIVYVQGEVEKTLPHTVPAEVSLLRLDTDWYESTYHELVHLFPLLSKKGVLLLDDYGHWLGAREAVDTYLKENGISMLLNRTDYTGYVGIKP